MYEATEAELWRRAKAAEDNGEAILALCLRRVEEALESDEFEDGVEEELRALHRESCICLTRSTRWSGTRLTRPRASCINVLCRSWYVGG